MSNYELTNSTLSKLIADKLHRVTATCYKITKDWQEAEDAAQRGCMNAFRHMSKFRGDCTPYSWLTRIAVNEAKRIVDNRARRPPSEDVPVEVVDSCGDMAHAESPDKIKEMTEVEAVVSESLKSMLPEFKEALSLREDSALSYDEIAKKLGIPSSTARTRVTRAKRHIKSYLEEMQA